MAATGETLPGFEVPEQPQLFVIEGGEQDPQQSNLIEQATRAIELIAALDEVQRELDELPQEAIILAAQLKIEDHRTMAILKGGENPDSIELEAHKDKVLRRIDPDSREQAIARAYGLKD
jgi:hypothetical protein